MSEEPIPHDFDPDALWDFADPAGSESRFRAALTAAPSLPAEARAEIQTQIARAQGLQRRFAEGHATLDEIESSPKPRSDRVDIRIALERGRLRNSSGDSASSVAHFTRAWELARTAGEDALAVDAAHMLAIVVPGEGAMPWHERAFALARSSPDAKAAAWIGSLGNNLGWTLHDLGRAEEALEAFQKALTWREAKGDMGTIRIARWAVARCLRTLARPAEALAIQQSLAEELAAAGEDDPYVDEEIGECLLALGRAGEAAPHFARAHAGLAADRWLAEHEPDRLKRLHDLATAALSQEVTDA